MKLTSSERALYLSLWAILILGGAFWKLHFSRRLLPAPASISVRLSTELQPWFASGEVMEVSDHSYTLRLDLRPEYQRSLQQDEATYLKLGFRVQQTEQLLHQGTLRVRIEALRPAASLVLPYTSREPASHIDLFLQ